MAFTVYRIREGQTKVEAGGEEIEDSTRRVCDEEETCSGEIRWIAGFGEKATGKGLNSSAAVIGLEQ